MDIVETIAAFGPTASAIWDVTTMCVRAVGPYRVVALVVLGLGCLMTEER